MEKELALSRFKMEMEKGERSVIEEGTISLENLKKRIGVHKPLEEMTCEELDSNMVRALAQTETEEGVKVEDFFTSLRND